MEECGGITFTRRPCKGPFKEQPHPVGVSMRERREEQRGEISRRAERRGTGRGP